MIKVQSASDLPKKDRLRCNACGKPLSDDKNSICVDIAHDFFCTWFFLCDSCRRELHEKI